MLTYYNYSAYLDLSFTIGYLLTAGRSWWNGLWLGSMMSDLGTISDHGFSLGFGYCLYMAGYFISNNSYNKYERRVQTRTS